MKLSGARVQRFCAKNFVILNDDDDNNETITSTSKENSIHHSRDQLTFESFSTY